MHKDPPDHLVTQLDELGLCNPRQFRAVQGRVRRLTRDLPAFDRVWLDALVQARRITPFQAERFSDGKGPGIKVGSYVLMFPLGSSDLGTTYHARCLNNHNPVSIKLFSKVLLPAEEMQEHYKPVIKKLCELQIKGIVSPVEYGIEKEQFWIACPFVTGPSCRELLIHEGRLNPVLVREIASQLLDTLSRLWSFDLLHGNLSINHVLIGKNGHVFIADTALRMTLPQAAIVTERALPPERFDYLAPEICATGRVCSVESDQYSLGCLLWHLLTGRPPFPGADPETKRIMREKRPLPDVREFAPETPDSLAGFLTHLLQQNPDKRITNWIEWSAKLGSSRLATRQRLARRTKPVVKRLTRQTHLSSSADSFRAASITAIAAAACACLLFICTLLIGTLSKDGSVSFMISRILSSNTSPSLSIDSLPEYPSIVTPIDGRTVEQTSMHIRQVDNQRDFNGTRKTILLTESSYLVRGNSLISLAQPKHRLTIEPHMRIQGANSQKSIVIVQNPPWRLTAEEVEWRNLRLVVPSENIPVDTRTTAIELSAFNYFRNCTFETQTPGLAISAFVGLRETDATFEQCSFAGPSGSSPYHINHLPTAVHIDTHSELSPIVVSFLSCSFQSVSSVLLIESPFVTANIHNCSHRGPGPLAQFDLRYAESGHTLFSVQDCNLSELGTVIEFFGIRPPDTTHHCTIQANNSTFQMREQSSSEHPLSLISFSGALPSEALVQSINWQGMGNQVLAGKHLYESVWNNNNGVIRPLPESLKTMLEMEGLVLGQNAPRKLSPNGIQ